MYRTIYSTRYNAWLIQLLWANAIWRTIKTGHRDGSPCMFDTLDDAEEFIEKIGIDRQYRRHGATYHTAEIDLTETRH
jgi:hypothetical protein